MSIEKEYDQYDPPVKLKLWEVIYYPVYRFFSYHWRLDRKVMHLVFRIRNGFWERETWNLYDYGCDFFIPRLEHLKKTHQGYPSGLHDEELGDEAGSKRWEEILDKIILAFRYSREEGIEEFYHIKGTWHWKDEETGYYRMEFDIDEEKKKLHDIELDRREKVIKEGFELFAEYYRSLWD